MFSNEVKGAESGKLVMRCRHTNPKALLWFVGVVAENVYIVGMFDAPA